MEADSYQGRTDAFEEPYAFAGALLRGFGGYGFGAPAAGGIPLKIDLCQPLGILHSHVTHQNTDGVRRIIVFLMKRYSSGGTVFLHIGFPADGWITVGMGGVGCGVKIEPCSSARAVDITEGPLPLNDLLLNVELPPGGLEQLLANHREPLLDHIRWHRHHVLGLVFGGKRINTHGTVFS
ncbi:hypothetical protein ES703_101550 [subsurface metagenome]